MRCSGSFLICCARTLKGANGEVGVYVVFADFEEGLALAVNGDKSSGKNVVTYMEVVETDTK